MSEDREKHLRMCEALSGLIASEGYKEAIATLKANCKEFWSATKFVDKDTREQRYLEFNALVMLDQQLLRLANEYRSIEIDRKAQEKAKNG